ncbi:MAG: tetratricopeptide repeat protein [Anaerolineae bacterium]
MIALCQQTGINKRKFYRRLNAGIEELTDFVVTAELHARQEAQVTRFFDRLPERTYAHLYGRDVLLAELEALVRDPAGPRLISLEGPPGVGKTALARHFAEVLLQRSPPSGLAWVNLAAVRVNGEGHVVPIASACDSVRSAVRSIASQLGYVPDADTASPDAVVQHLRAMLRQDYLCLIVLDGLDSLPDWPELIRLLMPLTLHVHLLVTSRVSLARFEAAALLPVLGLDREAAQRLFTSACTRHQLDARFSRAQFAALYETCAGNPQFLEVVAARLRLLGRQYADLFSMQVVPAPLLDALAPLFEPLLKRLSPDARLLLLTLCCSAQYEEERDWVQRLSGLCGEAYEAAEDELVTHFVARRTPGTTLYRLHMYPLIRAYIHGQLQTVLAGGAIPANRDPLELPHIKRYAARLRAAVRELAAELEAFPEPGRAEVVTDLERYYVLLRAAVRWLAGDSAIVDLIAALHPLPLYSGGWEKWRKHLDFAIGHLEQQGRYIIQGRLMVDLATAHYFAGDWEAAIAISRRLFDLSRQHDLALTCVAAAYYLIDIYTYLERESEARALFKMVQSLPLIQSAAGVVGELSRALLGLTRAWMLAYAGEFDAALSVVAAEETRFAALPEMLDARRIEAFLRRTRADVQAAAGQVAEASEWYLRALELHQELDDIYSQSLAHGKLGRVYRAMGELDQAVESTQTAHFYARKHNARWHVMLLTGDLAGHQLYMGKLWEARQLNTERIEMARTMQPVHEQHRALVEQAAILYHLDQTVEALRVLNVAEQLTVTQPLNRALQHLYRARYHLVRQQIFLAYDELEAVRPLAEQPGRLPVRIAWLRVMAEAANRNRKVEDARAYALEALSLAESTGRQYDRAACLLLLSALESGEDRRRERWEEAYNMLVVMGAGEWLKNATPVNPPALPILF